MSIPAAVERLLELDKQENGIRNERTKLLEEIRKEMIANKNFGNLGGKENLFKFTTNIEAFKFILAQHPEGLHVNSLVEKLESYGIFSGKSNVSGVLRKYSADGRTFEALGGNRFKLKEEVLPKKNNG